MPDDSKETHEGGEATIVRSALWSAYGDALGFISELVDAGALRQRIGEDRVLGLIPWRRNIGGRFGATVELPAGCYSDDTQLRLATGRAIRGDGYFDVEAFAKIELPVWLCYALGAGRSTRAAATQLARRDVNWFSNFFESRGQKYERSGGNGAAMRVQPHVWAAKDRTDRRAIAHDVIRNALCTHGHPRAVVGALFHSYCVAFALAEREVPGPTVWRELCEVSARMHEVVSEDDDLRSFWLPVWEERTGVRLADAFQTVAQECLSDLEVAQKFIALEQFDYAGLVRSMGALEEESRGSGTKTAIIAAALAWACRRSDPQKALQAAANLLFSDTDTISSMAGAILGVIAESEPCQEILDREYITREARRLYELSIGKRVNDFDYPDVMQWGPPQSQLDVVRGSNGCMVMGLGEARAIGQSFESRGKQDAVWQWLKLSFGQSILAKRRASAGMAAQSLSKPYLPAEQDVSKLERREEPKRRSNELRNMELFDHQTSYPPVEKDASKVSAPLDEITAEVIRSGFDERLIGRHLLRLALDEGGIELAVAFAAIVAKAKRARSKSSK